RLLDGFLQRNPAVGSLFSKKGNARVGHNGSTITVISSDSATAWGLGSGGRRFRVVADELTSWPRGGEELWAALASSSGKTEDAQLLIASNAGYEAGRSWQWNVRET